MAIKSDKLPALQFYPGDWAKDPGIQSLDLWHRGFWFEILLLMHESDERGALLLNEQPMPIEALAQRLSLTKNRVEKGIEKLLHYGICTRREDGVLINRRMIRDENLKKIRQKTGRLGGNPSLMVGKPNPYYSLKKDENLVNQIDNQVDNQIDNQKITPSSSSSSSTSVISNKGDCAPVSSKKESHKQKLRNQREEVLKTISDGTLNKALRGWCEWREKEHPKKKPVTPQALRQLLKRYERRGSELLNDLRYSVSQDWEGIFPERKNQQRSSFEAKKPESPISKRGLDFVGMAKVKSI